MENIKSKRCERCIEEFFYTNQRDIETHQQSCPGRFENQDKKLRAKLKGSKTD
ncbi:hypothetical protein IID24_04130 [Patescibacteria group bacterium]|nr:hypothetical protein [Patescibacteria group bacterium]